MGAVPTGFIDQVSALAELLLTGNVAVLSGAGLSTESGIPDYRGPSGVLRRHSPMTYQEFIGDERARRRYWARSHAGWRTFAQAKPNGGHRAVTELQQWGLLTGIVTQNVDGLHQAAGGRDVIELHGGLDRVVCLTCDAITSRAELDQRLREANPHFDVDITAINPDGDVEVGAEGLAQFHLVGCEICRTGLLKPDVVFFGETVPARRVRRCFELVESSRALLVLGSSLSVLSGRRFVLHAARQGISVAIINRGATRGDALASVTIDGALGDVLTAVVQGIRGA